MIIAFVYVSMNMGRTKPCTAPFSIAVNDPLPAPPLSSLHHAVIVAGHAIYTGPKTLDAIHTEDHWILEPFQQGTDQVPTFVKHIQKGIELAREDPNAVLIFTGGQTRPGAGPQSEGLSYWQIAQILMNSTITEEGARGDVGKRMVIEEFARDSHENLLFSLCRFAEMTGQYPSSVTVIGFDFKRERFVNIHRAALRLPADQFEYIGIDPLRSDTITDTSVKTGELQNSYNPFKEDMYGCHGSLKQKKLDRNPFRRRHAYRYTCPALADILNYCPANNEVFQGALPWDSYNGA
ncbi:hypothetical protein EC973_008382 [Apophysomyces ossiformis]|uniref:DUF218 domain-containing protein n=1 Tax=Apophysomyces ossiformis TaxID=679940 RepID=A0A8H7BQR7_9FUNG|nr:hypothetical protein EC973_008382 [Apophysomyces ossiformis]